MKKINIILISLLLIATLVFSGCGKKYVCADGSETSAKENCPYDKIATIRDRDAENSAENYVKGYLRNADETYTIVNTYREQGDYYTEIIISSKDGSLTYESLIKVDGRTASPECVKGCDFIEQKSDSIGEGTLSGNLILTSGDCMPYICDDDVDNCSNPNCIVRGVSGVLKIRDVTSSDDISNVYLNDNKPDLIDTVTSYRNGSFSIVLPTGEYSVFVVDDGKEYCNTFNEGKACSFEISNGQETMYDISIDKAVY